MNETAPSPEEIKAILQEAHVVAVVGLSPKPERASHQVAQYLKEHGYRVVPVNPGQKEILGEKCYRTLTDVPFPIDVVDIFRNVEAIPAIVDEAIAIRAKVVWMQLGLAAPDSARRAREAGLKVVMDHCIKIEHNRYLAGGR